MRVLGITLFIVTVFGETPTSYPSNRWRPQGQQFPLPPRQQFPQQYGAPQPSQQYGSPQLSQQYGAPQLSQQYGTPQNSQQYNTLQFSQQYNSPQLLQQYNRPQENNREYGVPSVDPLRVQYLPSEQPARNFGQSNFNFNQNQPDNRYVPSEAPRFNNENLKNTNFDPRNNLNQQQFGRLVSQNNQLNTQNFQGSERPTNVENRNLFNKQNESRDREQIDELFRGQLGENDKEYVPPTTTKRPIKATKKPEKTTEQPQTTTEEPDEDYDQQNVAVSTAVAGSPTSGQYYILQPDGRLQRVVYMTSPDTKSNKNGAYVANLMYETVEPLKGPIYQYVGSQLVRIN